MSLVDDFLDESSKQAINEIEGILTKNINNIFTKDLGFNVTLDKDLNKGNFDVNLFISLYDLENNEIANIYRRDNLQSTIDTIIHGVVKTMYATDGERLSKIGLEPFEYFSYNDLDDDPELEEIYDNMIIDNLSKEFVAFTISYSVPLYNSDRCNVVISVSNANKKNGTFEKTSFLHRKDWANYFELPEYGNDYKDNLERELLKITKRIKETYFNI